MHVENSDEREVSWVELFLFLFGCRKCVWQRSFAKMVVVAYWIHVKLKDMPANVTRNTMESIVKMKIVSYYFFKIQITKVHIILKLFIH